VAAKPLDTGPTTWTAVGNLKTPTAGHTATLLQNGQILIAGGQSGGTLNSGTNSSEVYDPTGGVFVSLPVTSTLTTLRENHTATLLTTGQVLVAGGDDAATNSNSLYQAEIFDPVTLAWGVTSNLNVARTQHTATLLQNGNVLIAGGIAGGTALSSAEVYNYSAQVWTLSTMTSAHYGHTATLLPSGKVLVAGGISATGLSTTAELFDPSTGTWAATGSLHTARQDHTATLLTTGTNAGKVLVTGGTGGSGTLLSSELYDPSTGTWTTTSSLNAERANHSATLLPNGQVLVTGGDQGGTALTSNEVFDPQTSTWSTSPLALGTARTGHTAALLPGDIVVVAGGKATASTNTGLSAAEEFDPTKPVVSSTATLSPGSCQNCTTTVLSTGKVLVAGGLNGSGPVATAELYDPVTGNWSSTGSMVHARAFHTAALLPTGQVLVAGGQGAGGTSLSSTELYDSSTGTWASDTLPGAPLPMNVARQKHTMTVLPSGNLLVVGGQDASSNPLSSVEEYFVASNTWVGASPMFTARYSHTATLMPSTATNSQTVPPQILVAGGETGVNTATGSAELYNTATGQWSQVLPGLTTARASHTASLLPNGNVLIAGGDTFTGGTSGATASAEIYNLTGASAGTITLAGVMTTAREQHTATVLPSGVVLVAGGSATASGSAIGSAELYDLAAKSPVLNEVGVWNAVSLTGTLTPRANHTATLLETGAVLLAGGSGSVSTSADLYNRGVGFTTGQPVVNSAPVVVPLGSGMLVQGTGFQGLSEASGGHGSQNSSTNYPLLNFRAIGTEQTSYILSRESIPWSSTSFDSVPPTGFTKGFAYVTLYANGVPNSLCNGIQTSSCIVYIGTASSTTTVASISPLSLTKVPNQSLSVSITAQVTSFPTSSSSSGAVNEGTVTFSITDQNANQIAVGAASVVNGVAASSPISLPSTLQPGTYTVTATFVDSGVSYSISQNTGSFTVLLVTPTRTSTRTPTPLFGPRAYLPFVTNNDKAGW
jgi:N-acetylneuraminic acid mutarotase